MRVVMSIIAVLSMLSACAGRAPDPVAVVQPMDNSLTCTAMMAEISSNNGKISDLGGQKGAKVAQNVAAGVVGLVVWPVWFLMDFQEAAGTEIKALQDRNAYLATKVNGDGCHAAPDTATAKADPVPAPTPAPVYAPPATTYGDPAPAYAPAAPVYSPAPPVTAYAPQAPAPIYPEPAAYPRASAQPYAPPATARAYAPPPVGAYRPDAAVIDVAAPSAPRPSQTPPGGDPYAIDPYAIDPAPAPVAVPSPTSGETIPAWMAPL